MKNWSVPRHGRGLKDGGSPHTLWPRIKGSVQSPGQEILSSFPFDPLCVVERMCSMQFPLLLKVVGVSTQVVRRVWQLPEEMTRLALYSDVVGITCRLARQPTWRYLAGDPTIAFWRRKSSSSQTHRCSSVLSNSESSSNHNFKIFRVL